MKIGLIQKGITVTEREVELNTLFDQLINKDVAQELFQKVTGYLALDIAAGEEVPKVPPLHNKSDYDLWRVMLRFRNQQLISAVIPVAYEQFTRFAKITRGWIIDPWDVEPPNLMEVLQQQADERETPPRKAEKYEGPPRKAGRPPLRTYICSQCGDRIKLKHDAEVPKDPKRCAKCWATNIALQETP